MGVRGGFWKALQPYARQEGMGYLRGRRVAVDLSVWIVSAMTTNSPSFALHNIFFRTLSLFSKMGAFPVFVVDGVPSPLKAKATSDAFTRCVDECVQLLGHLGMPILRAKGEAEALCAQLNCEGKVDACITSDSDAFLCGANTVIKVFRSTAKEPFECYNMGDIQDGSGLSRKRMIAMALLIGSDHDLQGVPGVGLETALAFVQLFDEDHILDELRAISKGIYPAAAFASQCPSFDKACDLNWKIKVCKRLADHANFPNEEIIKLYLCDDNLDTEWDVPSLVWNEQPNVEALVDMLSFGNWEKSDIRRHMLLMLSTIYLREMASSSPSSSKSLLLLDDQYEFHSVKRIKIIHGQPYYLVQWKRHADNHTFVHTDEDVQLVDDAFPNEARRLKWLIGEKSRANRNRLLGPKKQKSRANRNRLLGTKEEKSRSKLKLLPLIHNKCRSLELTPVQNCNTSFGSEGVANNMLKTAKGARPRWVQLSIKDFYRSKKTHLEMGQITWTRKSSPVERRRLLLG